MDLQACQRCGSTDLRAPSVGDGSLPGVSDVQWFKVCRRCGLRDVPLEFAAREDLVAHQAASAGWEDAEPDEEPAEAPRAGSPPETGQATPASDALRPLGKLTFTGRLIMGWGVLSLVTGLLAVGALFVTETEVPRAVMLVAVPLGLAQSWAFIAIGRRMREPARS